MNIVKPKKLQKGDTIGIIAPCGVFSDPERLEKGIEFLESAGFKIKVSDKLFARERYMAGKDDVRAGEIEKFFADDDVDGIICARGGYGAIRLINQINYDIIRQNPKVFCGFSDVTALFRSVRSRADGEAPSEYSRVFRRIAVTVIHTAVFLVLLAGMFGAGDRVRCRLTAHQGVPEGMALTDDGRVVGLPFSVVLRKFSIDEYPPRLYVRDMHVGEDSEEFLSVEEEGASASFEGWTFSADTVLDMAGRLPSETVYRAMEHVGAVPAVHVTAVSDLTGETRSGWVSCGSHIFAASSLDLGGGKVLVMPYPQARRYLSEVTVNLDGKATDMDIEVNHPGKVGSWRIYQSGYDTSKGKWSTVSVLECVRDPWYGAVHVALWLILAAGAVMSAAAVSRRRRSGESGRAVPCGDSGKGKEGGS